MQTTHGFRYPGDFAVVPEFVRNAWTAMRDWINKWIVGPARKRRIYRQAVAELQALDDRMLRDIGISRSDIHWIAHKRAYGPEAGSAGSNSVGSAAANDNRRQVRRRTRRSRRPAKLKAA